MNLSVRESSNSILFFLVVSLFSSETTISDRSVSLQSEVEIEFVACIERREIEVGRSIVNGSILTIRVETRMSDASSESE